MSHCPGQDSQKWKPEDIAFLACPWCGGEVEIWKDEPMRFCPSCRKPVRNPKAPQDCEKWCAAADQCPGVALKRKATGVALPPTPLQQPAQGAVAAAAPDSSSMEEGTE